MSGPSPPKKLLFVLSSLRGGGAERVALRHMQTFPRDGYELHVALAHKDGAYLEDLPEDVVVHDLKASRVLFAIWPLMRLVRRLRPQVVLSSTSHVNLAATLARSMFPAKTRLFLRETNPMQRVFADSGPLLRMLYRRGYRRADRILCQTDFMRSELRETIGADEDRLVVLRNPLDFDSVHQLSQATENPFPKTGPNVLAAGSLSEIKGFDRLIDSFAGLRELRPDAQLWFLGEGPEKAALQQRAKERNLADRTHFVGFQKNPFAWMRFADLFVNCSRYESSPNVLLEAIACECPVVVRRCPGGAHETLELTEQAWRLTDELEPWRLEWLEPPAAEVRQKAIEHYSAVSIVKQLRELCEQA